jgi:hypothetical protein
MFLLSYYVVNKILFYIGFNTPPFGDREVKSAQKYAEIKIKYFFSVGVIFYFHFIYKV